MNVVHKVCVYAHTHDCELSSRHTYHDYFKLVYRARPFLNFKSTLYFDIYTNVCQIMLISLCVYLDKEFTMKSFGELEAVGVVNLRDIEKHKEQFANAVGIEAADLMKFYSFLQLLEMWIKGQAKLRPTWRHFLWILREIKLAHIADRIEHYFSGIVTDVDPNPKNKESERSREEEEGECISNCAFRYRTSKAATMCIRFSMKIGLQSIIESVDSIGRDGPGIVLLYLIH